MCINKINIKICLSYLAKSGIILANETIFCENQTFSQEVFWSQNGVMLIQLILFQNAYLKMHKIISSSYTNLVEGCNL